MDPKLPTVILKNSCPDMKIKSLVSIEMPLFAFQTVFPLLVCIGNAARVLAAAYLNIFGISNLLLSA